MRIEGQRAAMGNSWLWGIVSMLAFAANPSSGLAQVKAVRFGALIDGTGRVFRDAVVIVERDRIARVATREEALPGGAEIIDLGRYTGLPGLIDVHTHMTYYWDQRPGTRPWGQGASRPVEVTVRLAAENARRTLETGVTTVRDLGASGHADILMRDLIERGEMVGPRMLVSGYGLQRARAPVGPAGAPGPPRGRVTDISEIADAVRHQVEAGADVIKVFGSTGSGADVSGRQTFTLEEMKAAVAAAHSLGKRIAIHSYGPDGGRAAVLAGAESVEHAVDLDDATLAEMARRGTVYVPTIDHNRYYAEYRDQFGYTAEQVAQLDAYRRRNLETARRAFRAGVRIAMGSDAVFTMFGQNTRELGWFVEIGMTPAQALATATTNAAALLGMASSIGAVAAGYYADLVAVEGDPLADIDVILKGVRWVMKGGNVVIDRTH
jgi:imidazolonepropionase-like amidohydrolase